MLAVPEFAVQALKLPFLYLHFLISSFEPDFACLLCRIVSDCIPIKGRKRVPYLVIATVLSLVPWLILGLNATLRNSSWQLMTFLTVQNLGSAMADVVVDAMIAEAVRHEKYVQNWDSFNFFAMQFELHIKYPANLLCQHKDLLACNQMNCLLFMP